MEGLEIYKGKTVMVTGHTGFKGSWLSIWLHELGAKVVGYSLEKYDNDILFKKTKLKDKIIDVRGDIRDKKRFTDAVNKHKPCIIFHLAAQPLVRKSYDFPLETFETNVLGTANVLDCIKEFDFIKASVIITTDKCYKNKEKKEGYCEEDELGGHDPYSASKACAEIVAGSYRNSFFKHQGKLVATARAGNVIGGGDYAADRLVPDCIKALEKGEKIIIRSPDAVRPWQHVIEPVYGYLLLGRKLLEGKEEFAEAWNFGPDKESMVPVKKVADLLVKYWEEGEWVDGSNPNEKKHETIFLCLDNSKAKIKLGWKPKLKIEEAVSYTVEWYRNFCKEDMYKLCLKQIEDYNNIKLK